MKEITFCTCVPKRRKHQDCADDVDAECRRHLSASRFEPDPELLDAVIPLVPVREGGRIVHILQNVNKLVGVISSPPKLTGCKNFHQC